MDKLKELYKKVKVFLSVPKIDLRKEKKLKKKESLRKDSKNNDKVDNKSDLVETTNVKYKEVKVSYCVKAVFFVFFVPLFRREWLISIYMIFSLMLFQAVMVTFHNLTFQIVFQAIYLVIEWFWIAYLNKLHLRELIKAGYLPAQDKDLDLIFYSNYITKDSDLGKKLEKKYAKKDYSIIAK